MDELFVTRSKLSNLILRGPGKSPIEKYQARLAELETQTSELEAKLSALSFQYRQLATSITLNDVQTLIPVQSTLLEFFLYYPFSIETQTYGAPRYAVYTLDRTGKIGSADVGERSEIDSLVKEFRQALAATGDQRNLTKLNLSTARRQSLDQVQKLARQLDAKLLQPVRKFIGEKDHLLLSPDGALNLIPFAALVDESHRYLVESHEITYLSSGRDLLRLKEKVPTNQPALVLANPKFDDGSGPTIFGQNFDPLAQLPGGEEEGKFLKSLFPKTQLKQGADATETAIKQANQPEILHIATHGYFLEPDQATQTLTQALENRSLSLSLSDQTVSPEFVRQSSPLLRSMLFFSGANRQPSTTENTDDGILTALEVASLNLWGTKLVVLSACDTGVGEIKRGDGVYGLRRALVLAGSESQMISLWPVSDAGTRELMFKFYRRLKAGEGRSEALRNAQLDLIKNPKRNHPYFWASFIQSGEWANLDGKRKE
ncbi:MAG TPA: CHAT domain-containing protein [Acidobacteriota bacterium]|nr:CHAT domain-containing protein [Acidobacteriota bacterium]